MKPIELRIGNYAIHNINGNDEVVEIDQISKVEADNTNCILGYIYQNGEGTAPIEFFHEITLIEEWLKNFRFEEVSYGPYSQMAAWQINEESQRLIMSVTGIFKPLPNGQFIQLNTSPIRYVHTLQNIYWCLTGKELIYEKDIIKASEDKS